MLLPVLLALTLHQAPLTTVAEQSGWTRTGRYAEVESLCRSFPQRYPGKVRCDTFGTTPEGRPMLALVASADGTLTPAAASKKGRPVVLFQGGIHAGEIDGKDAGFWLLRDMLDGKALPGVLKQVTAVFVPVFNVDGHEHFGPNHRPNQVGPEEMGWRVTGQNLNLNRDYVKADAPEMVALLKLLHSWNPLFYVDLHVTDGAKFEHDVSVQMEPQKVGPEAMRTLGAKLLEELLTELESKKHLPLPFYPSFREDDDPTSGVSYGVSPPRFSHQYWAAHRRYGVLVETHSWKPYAHRVATTRHVLEGLLRLTARDAQALLSAVKAADTEATSGKVREVVLAWDNTDKSRPFAFRGYAYERSPSELTTQPWIRYDDSKPQVWTIPYYEELRPVLTASLPAGGYLVPPAHAGWVAQKLTTHGLRFQRLGQDVPSAQVEVFRATEAKFRPASVEGRQGLSVKGQWTKETRPLPAGTLYVPATQTNVPLLAHMLEPLGPDSLLSWGFFNNHFEQKEYVEDYVLEPFARELLARDAAVKAAWEEKLKDPEFARNPRARLRFFYERHPAHDTRFNLYPVFRTDSAPAGLKPAR
ncbi:M14 family zinc carboxypeptidase [Archangium violaceum]|uniref:Peptidase M14 n=1 Tax=Archangium violaceum Cb vi76 TaxID=1406225 RepID=A0A084SMQ8_9BACT|nr:M14 family zinc carboxypeptidase [Archangium violaceum]KFA89743.1 peptidase M14 [Archangium violaceum Cb vi76]